MACKSRHSSDCDTLIVPTGWLLSERIVALSQCRASNKVLNHSNAGVCVVILDQAWFDEDCKLKRGCKGILGCH